MLKKSRNKRWILSFCQFLDVFWTGLFNLDKKCACRRLQDLIKQTFNAIFSIKEISKAHKHDGQVSPTHSKKSEKKSNSWTLTKMVLWNNDFMLEYYILNLFFCIIRFYPGSKLIRFDYFVQIKMTKLWEIWNMHQLFLKSNLINCLILQFKII